MEGVGSIPQVKITTKRIKRMYRSSQHHDSPKKCSESVITKISTKMRIPSSSQQDFLDPQESLRSRPLEDDRFKRRPLRSAGSFSLLSVHHFPQRAEQQMLPTRRESRNCSLRLSKAHSASLLGKRESTLSIVNEEDEMHSLDETIESNCFRMQSLLDDILFMERLVTSQQKCSHYPHSLDSSATLSFSNYSERRSHRPLSDSILLFPLRRECNFFTVPARTNSRCSPSMGYIYSLLGYLQNRVEVIKTALLRASEVALMPKQKEMMTTIQDNIKKYDECVARILKSQIAVEASEIFLSDNPLELESSWNSRDRTLCIEDPSDASDLEAPPDSGCNLLCNVM